METTAEVNGKVFTVKLWHSGDPFPPPAATVGIDTETTLIDDIESIPDLAYAGFFSPVDNTCYIADHIDSIELLAYYCTLDTVQYYFNAAFDFLVFCKAMPRRFDLFWAAMDTDRVIATDGFTHAKSFNLKGLCSQYLNYEMDKGEDKGEEADRLTFRPGVRLTISQMQYLGIDCYTTWAIGDRLIPRPTEATQTRGSIMLRYIETNGLNVDRRVWDAFERMLFADKAKYRQELLSFGFPDPEPQEKEFPYPEQLKAIIDPMVAAAAEEFRREASEKPNKDQMRRILIICYINPDIIEHAMPLIMAQPNRALDKKEKLRYVEVLETFNLGAVDTARKSDAMIAVTTVVLRTILNGGLFSDAMDEVDALLMDNPEWLAKPEKPIGPKQFMQNHLAALVKTHADKKLKLARTKKSGELKLAKDDLWKLADLGINDPFLTAHQNYTHVNKFLSTYLNAKYIRRDGKIHPRFTNILRTGRTSCHGPNVQNLPSRGSIPLKNVFRPPEGMILCATDFSFIELVCFAQSCYTRFGKSVMRDVINAGVDPHRWFAGVMHKLIPATTEELSKPEYVVELNAMLEREVTKKWRQDAKAANFGLPGGMKAPRFHQHCRAQGISITLEEATAMREEWVNAFTEMQLHLNSIAPIIKSPVQKAVTKYYSTNSEDEEDEADASDGAPRIYSAESITGMLRNACTANSALNFQFQPLAAYGAKEAGWEVLKLGYGPRLYNFVHRRSSLIHNTSLRTGALCCVYRICMDK